MEINPIIKEKLEESTDNKSIKECILKLLEYEFSPSIQFTSQYKSILKEFETKYGEEDK